MDEHQLQQIRDTIAESIETTVNGKIRVLTGEFRQYVKDDTERWDRYKPYLEGLANLSGGSKIIIWIVVAIGSVAAAILAVKGFFISNIK